MFSYREFVAVLLLSSVVAVPMKQQYRYSDRNSISLPNKISTITDLVNQVCKTIIILTESLAGLGNNAEDISGVISRTSDLTHLLGQIGNSIDDLKGITTGISVIDLPTLIPALNLSVIQSLLEAVTTIIVKVADLQNALPNLVKTFKSLPINVLDSLLSVLKDLRKILQNIVHGIRDLVEDIKNMATNFLNSLISPIKQIFGGLLGDLASGLTGRIKELFNIATDLANTVVILTDGLLYLGDALSKIIQNLSSILQKSPANFQDDRIELPSNITFEGPDILPQIIEFINRGYLSKWEIKVSD